MSKNEERPISRRRKSMTMTERRSRAEETHITAISTIEAEAEARRRKTERLKAAREALKS
ncbi:hypothetical protein SB748_25470 [Rhizobium sp. SIMBA_035]